MQAAPSVLTLEGDPAVRADLRLALEDAGFDVVAQTGDGAEAVELAREHRPDIVVLHKRDATSERILEERRVPIVEITGSFSSSQVVEAVTEALAAHDERTVSESRTRSLRSIESLVENLSFATPRRPSSRSRPGSAAMSGGASTHRSTTRSRSR